MVEGGAPRVLTIPVYRAFADALVAGLIAQYCGDRLGLARGIVLVPNNRAVRSVTDAFVRRAEAGLLLPRIVAIGDAGELPGLAIDPIDAAVPPAVEPLQRRLILARLLQEERALARQPVGAGEALRLAGDLAAALDELIAEDRAPEALRTLDVAPELAVHWQKSLELFSTVIARWPDELARLQRIDLPERRNRLLRALAARWRDAPPASFTVAAGVTSSAPAIAEVLAVVARLAHGAVVLPGLDLASPDDEWAAIGGGEADGAPRRPIESHPQHHLRLLLDRIGVARAEVRRWRWGDGRARKAVRGRVVSNAFAPARFTAKWVTLKPHLLKLPGVRLAEFAGPAAEAQGIAIALRAALEQPARTAALVTPERALAGRVVAHLKRWGIDADDSAGQPLAATPVGVLIEAVVQLALTGFAPSALLAVLKHPLVFAGETRLAWLDGVRLLDRALRGPRPAPGLAGLAAWFRAGNEREALMRLRACDWWSGQAALFANLEAVFAQTRPTFPAMLGAVRVTLERIAGEDVWAGPAGRAAADLFTELAGHAAAGPADVTPADLPAVLRQLLGEIAIRPPQGGHPRIAILGTIEARLQQPDLLVVGGLNDGVWPAATTADPWLSPHVRRELGLADPERRIGLAAHDLATALGASEVLLSRSLRDARSATIASRFLLRLEAMTGGLARDVELPRLARAIDANPGPARPALRPAPSPPVAARPRRISVTEVDRLQADPFAFYARAMLKLSALDAVDADPGPAWRGSAVHTVLDRWLKEDGLDPERLIARVDALLADAATHPLVRALWQPRLTEAIEWVASRVADNADRGRHPVAAEVAGRIEVAGIELRGIADRVDRLADGSLAVVDYKTGSAPSGKAVAAGYAMQLGLLGAIAEARGFDGLAGSVGAFEYWSLTKNQQGGFGQVVSPVGRAGQIAREDFVAHALRTFTAAAERWLTGGDPFTAKLAPQYAPYEEYDQLMRRDEWYGREG